MAEALDAGYRHVDTAQTYDNQRAVGRAIRESLDRLGVDRVDTLYVHWPARASLVPIPRAAREHVRANYEAMSRDLDEDPDRIANDDRRERVIDPETGPWNR